MSTVSRYLSVPEVIPREVLQKKKEEERKDICMQTVAKCIDLFNSRSNLDECSVNVVSQEAIDNIDYIVQELNNILKQHHYTVSYDDLKITFKWINN